MTHMCKLLTDMADCSEAVEEFLAKIEDEVSPDRRAEYAEVREKLGSRKAT
jgi:hypothetical protein